MSWSYTANPKCHVISVTGATVTQVSLVPAYIQPLVQVAVVTIVFVGAVDAVQSVVMEYYNDT